MSAWMEILNTKQTESNEIKNTTRHCSVHTSALGGGTRHANRRQKRLKKHSGNPLIQITAGKTAVAVNKSPGLLQSLTAKFTKAAGDPVRYVALKQSELEKGPLNSFEDVSDRNSETISGSYNSSSSSSSEQDLFVTNSRRKQQRKMNRKGTYSMRETFESSRQYYPATHQHIHQHYNILQMQQQQQQQQQQQHHEQTLVQAQHCNLHKGVVGKQQHFQQQQQQQQQQQLVYQHQQKPQMRPDFSIQSQQQQQHQQQYQNIGTWLPQNKTTPTTTTTTQLNGNIDDLNYHRHHEQQQPQKPYHHLHHQQLQPINYCAKRLDSNIANGRNSCLIEDIEPDFIVGKTFITPPDIPSPPPQPIISENKKFQSGQTLSKTSAPTTATTSNTLINKTCCQCEGRLKNYQFTNHATPVAQQQHNTSHCHIHHQPPTSQPQQQQQQKQQHQHSSQISAHHHNNLPHQYPTHLRQHSHHQEQPNNEETLILPRATSALKSQHYHSNQHQQQPQQQQQFHQPSSVQQHYRKVDVFAAASLDDDDNDTSPSIKLNHHHYEYNNKLLLRNCKHFQNKQLQEQQNLKHNGWPYKPFPAKQDYELFNKAGDENLSRGFSLESYNSLYEAELNGWSQQHQHSQKKYFAVANAVNRVNGIQHIMCNDEPCETHLQQTEDVNVNAGHDNMDKMTLASNKKNKEILLPLDIPTPPLPLSYNINKRLLSSHNSNNTLNSCQCDKQTNFMHSNSTKNQVNHISIIQTTATNGLKTHYTHAQQHKTNPHPVTTKKENLTQMHNKGSSSSSTLSAGSGSGGIGCGMGLNFNVSDQHLIQHAQEPLQHHHLCQQKNVKLQQHFSNYQHQATHLHQQQQQHHYQHRYQQQQKKQQQTQCHQQQQQQLQHKQLPSYDAYASQQYLPQLPQLLSLNSNSNSLTLSHRRIAPTFNRIADKNYMKNLVYSPEKLRRVRIILCVVGGLVLLSLLCIALYFIISSSEDSTKDDNDGGPSNGMHLEDVLQGKLLAKHFNGSWSTDSNILYKENNAIMEYNVLTKQKTRLLLDTSQQYILYEKSADGTLLLLAKNYKKNFRHSFVAEYDIYDIESGVIKPLEIQKQAKHLIMVQWGPVGNALIINYERNLYYKPTAFADEIALTDDTNAAILNGIPDWVYEEEVFSSNSAVWFSPDGKKLAFIQFDDSPTHVINFPVYGEAGDLRFQYPFNRLVAYPKAGSPNPRVKLFTSDLDRAAEGNTDHLTNIPVPSALNTEGDYIITVVDWLNNTNVLSVWMNRIQNQAHVQIFNGLRRQKAYSLESKTGWVDFFSAPFKNRDGNRIAFIMPQAQDGYGEYRHLVVMSTASSNGKPEPLTKGKFVVTSILHWDTTHDFIFYTANTESHPEHLHVYAIKAATGQTAKCLTCSLHTSNGVKQTYYSADFNANNQVILTSLGPSLPQTAIYELVYAGSQVSLKLIVFWEDNDSLKMKLAKIDMPTTEIVNIPISNGFEAKVLLQLPPNMDRSGKTKYPLLVDVYGGPDSYSVVDKWIVDWGTYLSSNQSVIYAKIDGRGSGLRGEKLLHSVYLKLGTVEITDQIDVTRKLQQKYNFIDSNHTGIWGWSYGGYAAAMALANDNDHIFRCAASIAPVTDWAYYDSIYTERYMGLPAINELGYAASRLSTKAPQLKGKKFLLVHGTLDDNVHYQQAMILAKNLERHDILFKQISYPDEDHALAGVRPHLYHSLDRFFGDCFARPRMSHRQ